MAVKIQKLEGRDIPSEAQRKDTSVAFKITDDAGHDEYRYDDIEAAKRVVELSERDRTESRSRG
jgi:hypothetical protein